MGQQSVGRIAHGHVHRFCPKAGVRWHIDERSIDRTGEVSPCIAEETRHVEVIIDGKRIIHHNGRVKEVPRVDGRSGEVTPNRLQQKLIPLPRHRAFDSGHPCILRGAIYRWAIYRILTFKGQRQTEA